MIRVEYIKRTTSITNCPICGGNKLLSTRICHNCNDYGKVEIVAEEKLERYINWTSLLERYYKIHDRDDDPKKIINKIKLLLNKRVRWLTKKEKK